MYITTLSAIPININNSSPELFTMIYWFLYYCIIFIRHCIAWFAFSYYIEKQ